jgi:hypothetical protein
MIYVLHLTRSLSTGLVVWVDPEGNMWELGIQETPWGPCHNCGTLARRVHWIRLRDHFEACPDCVDLDYR